MLDGEGVRRGLCARKNSSFVPADYLETVYNIIDFIIFQNGPFFQFIYRLNPTMSAVNNPISLVTLVVT